MQLILDTGNVEEIKELCTCLPIDGVTTNPSIVSKEKKNFKQLINEIGEIIGEDMPIHAQVLSTKYEEILEEALYISSLRKKYICKNTCNTRWFKSYKRPSQKRCKNNCYCNIHCSSRFFSCKGWSKLYCTLCK